jgi:hypothetical protein
MARSLTFWLRLTAVALTIIGFGAFVAGIALIYPPGALIAGGATLAAVGLLFDFDRFGPPR